MAMPLNVEGLSVSDRATLRELTEAQGQAVQILIRQSSQELNQAYEARIRDTAVAMRTELQGNFGEVATALVEVRQNLATVQRSAEHIQRTNEKRPHLEHHRLPSFGLDLNPPGGPSMPLPRVRRQTKLGVRPAACPPHAV